MRSLLAQLFEQILEKGVAIDLPHIAEGMTAEVEAVMVVILRDGGGDDLGIHELIALIAPRPVYVASASQDLWADPKGEMLGLVNAVPVYGLYGYAGITIEDLPPENTPVVSDIMGYHLREGKHDVLLYDWEQYVAFADRFLK